MSGQVVTWGVREPPLPICGIFARGDVAHELAERLIDADSPGDYFISSDAIVALGDTDELPWVDGVTWLGRDGSLLCPTTLRPNVYPGLLVSAARRLSETEGTVVATPDCTLVLRRPDGALDGTALRLFAVGSTTP